MTRKTKAVDSEILVLPRRQKTAKGKKQAVTQESKNIKKRRKKAFLPSDKAKNDEILEFMGESEEGDLEIKIMCGNCREWSKAIKLNIAVNVDGEVSLLWFCYKCRRYNDITFGTVETRA